MHSEEDDVAVAINVKVAARFKEMMRSQQGNALMEAAIHDAMSNIDFEQLVRSELRQSMYSCVRSYFSHGPGRLAVQSAVEESISSSPLMSAVREARKAKP